MERKGKMRREFLLCEGFFCFYSEGVYGDYDGSECRVAYFLILSEHVSCI